jgi:hypothetical protein
MARPICDGVAICSNEVSLALRREGSGHVCTSMRVATTNQIAVAAAHAPKSQRDQTVTIELIGLRASLLQCSLQCSLQCCVRRSSEPSAQILKLPLRCRFDPQ